MGKFLSTNVLTVQALVGNAKTPVLIALLASITHFCKLLIAYKLVQLHIMGTQEQEIAKIVQCIALTVRH